MGVAHDGTVKLVVPHAKLVELGGQAFALADEVTNKKDVNRRFCMIPLASTS